MRASLRVVVIAPLLVLAVALSGCVGAVPSAEPALTDAAIGKLADALPQRTVTPLPAARLADGLLPPTNRWFSGMVFGDKPMPVFPLPLSFQLSTAGFAFGIPAVNTNANVIVGGFNGAVAVDVGADSQLVVAYDDASVTIAQRDGDTEIGRTLIAEGSPFVTFTASAAVTAHLQAAFSQDEGAWTARIGNTTYGLASPGTLSAAGTDLTLQPGQTATWFAVSSGGSLADFVAAARHPVTGTTVTFSTAGGRSTTVIHYSTVGDGKTIVAAMPHQYASLTKGTTCQDGTYESIYGQLKGCTVNELSWSVPAVEPTGSLDLATLNADEKARLSQQLAADFATTPAQPADTYYGGKWLYRLVNLLGIAEKVSADALASQIKARAVAGLDEWMQPDGCTTRDSHCFVYDADARGIVGLTASFGSDQFNDHHFHYGYFLFAAGVLAADEPALADRWAPVMNLLAADIATEGASKHFPQRRVFDAYAGHSWASGTAPFADGNNQESTSEAVAAWNGLALWAKASGQRSLVDEATWMLSSEVASAQAYATNFPSDADAYKGFAHSVISINWGAKRDYATWFSSEPSAMLGILVLPMSPVAGYLGTDASRIRKNLAEAAPAGYDVVFGDYLLMYSALAGPDAASAALAETASLNEDRIDDGDSRSYLLAWIMSRLKS